MRIESLELLRFGKFTDRRLEFPRAERDLHLVVGANEAGKSTVRAAISDLLYGIPVRTAHDFLHAKPDLRLGASLEHQGARLAFHRIKASRQTLRGAADAVLADTVLAPFLGETDRGFFDQMFGLDHDRLVAGGHSILSAADDVGRILFESASGVAGLGQLREALEQEAAALWAPRRAGDRAYYQAQDAFDEAGRRLKDVTVRTRDWAQRDEQRRSAQAELDRSRQRLAALRAERNTLERARRTAPWLRALREHEQALTQLGDTADLPADAMAVLLDAQQTAAMARVRRDEWRAVATQTRLRLHEIVIDASVLAHAAAIDRLAGECRRFADHAPDIRLRQVEVDAAAREAFDAAARLDWPAEDETALSQRLPGLAARGRLASLAAEHEVLRQRVAVAADASDRRQVELDHALAQRDDLGEPDDALALRDGLSRALALGDVQATAGTLEIACERARAALADARARLGRFDRPLDALRAMPLPSVRTIEAIVAGNTRGDADRELAQRELARPTTTVRQAEASLAHIRERHRPVDRGEVLDARRARDSLWSALRADPAGLPGQADAYVRQVDEADRLADARHETAQQSGELSGIEAELVRQRVEMRERQAELARLHEAHEARGAQWASLMAGLGLTGLALDDWSGWVDARRDALAADDQLRTADRERASLLVAAESARQALADPLTAAGHAVAPDASLPVCIEAAGGRVRALDTAIGQRNALSRQIADATRERAAEQATLASAQARLQAWQDAWGAALRAAGLSPDSDIEAARAALALFTRIDEALARMRGIRLDRIGPMQADLAGVDARAQALARLLDAGLVGQPYEAVSQALTPRLEQAREAQATAARLAHELQTAEDTVARQQADVDAARARLEPLRRIAGIVDVPGDGAVSADKADAANDADEARLRAAIECSDRRRDLRRAIAQAAGQLEQGSDGLSREALQTEADTIDLATLVVRLDELQTEESELVQAQSDLAARRQQAEDALARVAGHDEAVQANAARNEALARMTEAIERYLKVGTAARLLRWSIERFQDEKQGPVLKRASEIFAMLSLGSFAKLDVDRDATPPRLQGRRADGSLVGVDGMSEGTRDQLFLALRLSALALHLSQAHALPFIADDLFVNFDDDRSRAGLQALGELSRHTQVVFLSHHDHLVPVAREVFGDALNVIRL